jgi:hypothetical protein
LAVGTYNYKANVTAPTANYSWTANTSTLTVNKASPSLSLALDGSSAASQSRTYPNATNVQGSETNGGDSDLTYGYLWNGTALAAGATTFPARSHNITYNTSGGQNYTAAQTEIMLTVAQNTSTASYMNLTINGTESNKVYTYPAVSNATGWYTAVLFIGGAPTFTLFINGTSLGTANPVSNVTS